jgi:Golgi nucleoside diphosphatase
MEEVKSWTSPKKLYSVEEELYSHERHLNKKLLLKQSFQPSRDKPQGHDGGIRRMLGKQHDESDNDDERREKEMDVARRKYMSIIQNSGIKSNTIHGMIIDAGSTGSRMHVYEFAPRILENQKQVEEAVAGNRLSYPGTESRWTERLRPGIDRFAYLDDDDEQYSALAEYLSPLLEFAKTILHEKQTMWEIFPIYLKATAGMRQLPNSRRQRLMETVRNLFFNKTYCPFRFELEFARVISGEEEAIYGWTAVNFLKGSLLTDSEGTGVVMSPNRTFGALDLGGASTQISFYDPKEDIMSHLFKLQIGQGKHWNLYAHSFLQFGVNSAYDRLNARLYADVQPEDAEKDGVYNPCLPGKYSIKFSSTIQLKHGIEGWPDDINTSPYTINMRNDNISGDFEECLKHTKELLLLKTNSFCHFSHGSDCSFDGAYQPPLPLKSFEFGYFVGFSNIHHAFDFLNMESTSTLYELRDRTQIICAMSIDELKEYNSHSRSRDRLDDDELPLMCFRCTFVFALLHYGYGFHKSNSIMAVHAVDGHKVTWALGSMLYEINTLPWQYEQVAEAKPADYLLLHWIVFLCLTVASVWILSNILKSLHTVYHDQGIIKKLSDDDTDDIDEEEKYLLTSDDSGISKLHRFDKQVSMPIYGSMKQPQDNK